MRYRQRNMEGSPNTPVARSSLPCDNIDPLGVTVMPVATVAIYLNAAVDGPSGRRHSFSPITEGRLAPPGLAGRRRGCARRGLQNFVPRDVIQECNKGGIDRSVRSASLSKIKPL
jgi:hypothetical protein